MVDTRYDKAGELAAEVTDYTAVRGRSLMRDARDRFLANRAAIFCIAILAAIVLFVVVGPFFAVWDFETIDWVAMGDVRTLGAPSVDTGHFFGTDDLGRDLFSRTILATSTSLIVGLIGATMALVVGTAWGVIAGYYGGRLDSIMMRIVDILMAIPTVLVIILILVVAGRSFTTLFIALGAVSWLTMARIVRAQTLALKNREFVEAARAAGVSEPAIIVRHILPNLLGVVIVYASLLVPDMILAESFISFLGLGISEPYTSLGALISEGAGTMAYGTLWQMMFPLGFFIAIIFTMFFIGDGLRDALDPKDR
ncbi:Oligopeptide transport system permease protein OppC [Candidatus Rhodobacter oscarellae]|uniref:Oligopeptide transport system permease protein OppC n=1 Tax=Candidatus Rhodobacter oscarellae TaxID=1675527 RepID=A0A0J9EBR2_9RHOB|nr:ABC transporter permease subunit [Candidatus Rhodobacter lobularis]KMW59109.1 Oligopeptide transport system permease protein OppC [Candidatus Rhodobacter lobularis]